MELSSARELKAQVARSIVSPVAAAAVRGRVLSFAAQPMDEMGGHHRTFALGIARTDRDYRLAVRVQRRELLRSDDVRRIHELARGEVDVRYIGPIIKQAGEPWYQHRTRPLRIGASVAHYRVTAGTIGCFVKRRGADDATMILSNNHVLANENAAREGDAIVQPGPFDKGKKGKDTIGKLVAFVKLKAGGTNLVDCAVAGVSDKVKWEAGGLAELGALAGLGAEIVEIGGTVAKIGRTTGVTRGRVTAFEMDNVIVKYGLGNLRFDDQVEIEGAGHQAFSAPGDSGSLIVDEGARAVALLFAGGDTGGSNEQGLTYATPIRRVLEGLRVELVY